MSTKIYRDAKLIGRIIFANVLEYPLKKYAGFIQGVKESPLFEELSQKEIIKLQRLSTSRSLHVNTKQSTSHPLCPEGGDGVQVIARIKRKGRGFSIYYSNEDFNKIYVVKRERLTALPSKAKLDHLQSKEIGRFLHRLRRVSSRNKLTHRILTETLKYQRKYLSSNNPIDMLPFSRVSLANKLNISLSWISRVTKGMTIIIPNGQEKALSFFFPSDAEINKFRIKELLDREQESLEVGKINRPLSDDEISIELEKKYGLCISRWAVNKCRKALGIPIAKRRITSYKYPPISLNYSISNSLTIQSVNDNVPFKPGIYEISLKRQIIQYQKGRTEVIYMGSTKNLKKRLREHVGPSSKNDTIRAFLKKHSCLFRYVIMQKNWRKEEVRLYNLFVDTYGEAPKCNRVRP